MSELPCARCGRPALRRDVDEVSGRITPLCEACRRYHFVRLLILLLALGTAAACFVFL